MNSASFWHCEICKHMHVCMVLGQVLQAQLHKILADEVLR